MLLLSKYSYRKLDNEKVVQFFFGNIAPIAGYIYNRFHGCTFEGSILIMSIHTYTMPEKVKQLLPQHAKLLGDYVPPHENILIDAITILAIGKNLLVKGQTSSEKTKIAEK